MIKDFLDRYVSDNPNDGNKMYFMVMENCIRRNPEVVSSLIEHTSFLTEDTILKERLYHVLNNLDMRVNSCEICSKPTKFISVTGGYNRFCSKSCRNKNPALRHKLSVGQKLREANRTPDEKRIIQEKIESTNVLRYGTRRPAQNKDIAAKTKETNQKIYGKATFLQTDECKNILRDKMMEAHGVDHVSKTASFRESTNAKIKVFALSELRDRYPSLDIICYDSRVEDGLRSRTVTIRCGKCGKNYDIDPHLLFERMVIFKSEPCLSCNKIYESRHSENDFIEYVTSLSNRDFKRADRKVLGGKELDLLFPDMKLAFEYNGLYWHSDDNLKDHLYHRRKKDECERLGIFLVHVYEDEWTHRRPILESMIRSRFNLNDRVGARECEMRQLGKSETDDFMDSNHIQGKAVSSFNYGLFLGGVMVAAMTFSSLRRCVGSTGKNGVFEMVRFCNRINTNVIGGAAKLFKHFVRTVDPASIISYANYDKYSGGMYTSLGFESSGKTAPGYQYVVNGRRVHRYSFRKDALVRMGHDPMKTEFEIMSGLGYPKIYDSGNLKFTWNAMKTDETFRVH